MLFKSQLISSLKLTKISSKKFVPELLSFLIFNHLHELSEKYCGTWICRTSRSNHPHIHKFFENAEKHSIFHTIQSMDFFQLFSVWMLQNVSPLTSMAAFPYQQHQQAASFACVIPTKIHKEQGTSTNTMKICECKTVKERRKLIPKSFHGHFREDFMCMLLLCGWTCALKAGKYMNIYVFWRKILMLVPYLWMLFFGKMCDVAQFYGWVIATMEFKGIHWCVWIGKSSEIFHLK